MQGVPSSLRRMNQRRVLERLERGGPASRAELAQAIELSPPTVGKVVDALLAAGLVEETPEAPGAAVGRARSVVGRPGRLVRLEARTPRLVGVQLGVRHTRLSPLAVSGPQELQWAERFRTPGTAQAWRARLAQAARSLPIAEPWAVMVSVPGVVDEPASRVLLSPNLHWTQAAELPALLRAVWDAPVHLVQEIRALALGHLGAQPAQRDFLLVDVGEGVGGAAVIDGRLWQAPLALSGELGHSRVRGNRRRCGCGAVGCLETLLSRRGLAASLVRVHRHLPRRWSAVVQRVAEHGVEPWLAETLEAAGAVIGGALNVLGVRQVVLTGVPWELGPDVQGALRRAVQRSAMWGRFGSVQCEAALRRRGLGLAAAAMERVFLPVLDRRSARSLQG